MRASNQALAERIARAGGAQPTRGGIRALAESLEGDDLAGLFEAAVGDLDAEVNLALVAAAKGVALPTEALARLVPDVPDWESLMLILGASDERPVLLEALIEAPWTPLEHRACAIALLLHDREIPEGPSLTRMELRQMLRAELPSLWHDELILATARRLREVDPHVGVLYERATAKMAELHPEAIALPGRLSKEVAAADLELLPEHRPRSEPASAAVKVGRNDPCPCGSGKKFKKCCGAPGATPKAGAAGDDDRRLRPDRHLSVDDLRSQPGPRLARLPFGELSDEALAAALSGLVQSRHLPGLRGALSAWVERAVADDEAHDGLLVDGLLVLAAHPGAHGRLPETPPPDHADWIDAIRSPKLRRLARDVSAAGAPFTADDWALLEGACRAGLADPPVVPLDVAATLIATHPAIAAFLLRGLAIDAHPRDAEHAAAYVALARDLLGAPPDDPLPAVLRLLDKDDARADAGEARVAEERQARAALEEQLAELRAAMRRTRARNESLAAELETGREALAALEAADADEGSPAVDPEELRRLRTKVRELKGRIEEGKRERHELREQVELASESSAEQGPTPVEEPEPDEAPEEEVGGEPTRLRIPEWSARARKSLGGLPASVAHQAVLLAAQLAIGDPLARRGAKKLEGFENLRRARVGIHYRLLYVLHEDTLEVVDVLARENLDSHLGRYRKSIG